MRRLVDAADEDAVVGRFRAALAKWGARSDSPASDRRGAASTGFGSMTASCEGAIVACGPADASSWPLSTRNCDNGLARACSFSPRGKLGASSTTATRSCSKSSRNVETCCSGAGSDSGSGTLSEDAGSASLIAAAKRLSTMPSIDCSACCDDKRENQRRSRICRTPRAPPISPITATKTTSICMAENGLPPLIAVSARSGGGTEVNFSGAVRRGASTLLDSIGGGAIVSGTVDEMTVGEGTPCDPRNSLGRSVAASGTGAAASMSGGSGVGSRLNESTSAAISDCPSGSGGKASKRGGAGTSVIASGASGTGD